MFLAEAGIWTHGKAMAQIISGTFIDRKKP